MSRRAASATDGSLVGSPDGSLAMASSGVRVMSVAGALLASRCARVVVGRSPPAATALPSSGEGAGCALMMC
jgi:hypothetical protein